MIDEAARPGSPRVRRKRRARRVQILETAMRLLADEGLEKLTVVRLAEQLDYTAGALYRYFPSKDALLAEMQRAAIAELHAELSAAAGAAAAELDPPAPRVSALMPLVATADRFLAMTDERPELIRLVNVLLADPRNLLPDDQVAKTAALFAELLGDVERLFEEAARAGALADGSARTRTVMMWTSLQGATQLAKMRRFDPSRFDARGVGAELCRTLLAGWGARPADLDRAIALCLEENRRDTRH